MNYTLRFARQTLGGLLGSWFFWLNTAIMAALTLFIVSEFGPLLTTPALAEVAAGQLAYTSLATGTLLVLMFAQQVFVAEKQQRSLLALLCTPAAAGDILSGKAAGLTAAALLGAGISLLLPLLKYPVMLAALAGLKTGAAFAIVGGMLLCYSLLVGMLLLCCAEARFVYPALFIVNGMVISAQKHSRGYLEAHGLGGANWLHLVSLLVLCAAAAGVYSLYFSRQRMVSSA